MSVSKHDLENALKDMGANRRLVTFYKEGKFLRCAVSGETVLAVESSKTVEVVSGGVHTDAGLSHFDDRLDPLEGSPEFLLNHAALHFNNFTAFRKVVTSVRVCVSDPILLQGLKYAELYCWVLPVQRSEP